MTPKKIIRHAIVELYGPCPPDNFVQANDWATAIDWEDVKAQVDVGHPEFEWTHDNPKDFEIAEAAIFEVRHEMLQHAGHESETWE